jgi:CBS domain-containing protein
LNDQKISVWSELMNSLKVRDYMSVDVITFAPTDGVMDAMSILLKQGISGAPVVAQDGGLVGVLSEVDLMEVVVQDSYYNENVGIVADFMQAAVEHVDPDMDILKLAQRFVSNHRRRYPVLQDGVLVGQISRRDVLRAAMQFFSG